MNSFAINAYGEMGICVISQQETFSIRGNERKQVWEESLAAIAKAQADTSDEVHSVPHPVAVRDVSCEWGIGERRPGESGGVFVQCRAPKSGGDRCRRFRRMGIVNSAQVEANTKRCMESARRITSKEIDVESWAGPQQILPILNNSTMFPGDCGSCGGH